MNEATKIFQDMKEKSGLSAEELKAELLSTHIKLYLPGTPGVLEKSFYEKATVALEGIAYDRKIGFKELLNQL